MHNTPRLPTSLAFVVDFGSGTPAASFAEMSGLADGAPQVLYRAGRAVPSSAHRLPDQEQAAHITLKRGLVVGDRELIDWLARSAEGQAAARTVTIRLQDEQGAHVMTWTVVQARAVRVDGMLSAVGSSEVAIEQLVLSHGGVTVVAG